MAISLGKIPKTPEKVMVRITKRKSVSPAKYQDRKFHIYGADFNSVCRKIDKCLRDNFARK